jgi:hypothetical protein
MGAAAGPDIVEDGLVFMFDMSNTKKSWKGRPTTNLVNNAKNFSGTNYGFYVQWKDTTLEREYLPKYKTPIGKGATLITESQTYGWQALSRMGGGGFGNDSISLFVYPLTDNMTMQCGMLGSGSRCIFDFSTMTANDNGNTFNGFIRKVNGYNNWYRIGTNIGGRSGGWVGSIGFKTRIQISASSLPQSAIVTGLQYEYNPYPTQFIEAKQSRNNNNSITDLTNKTTPIIENITFLKDNSFEFNGTDDYIRIPYNINDFNNSDHTILCLLKCSDILTSSNSDRLTPFKDGNSTNSWNPGLWFHGTIIRAHTNGSYVDAYWNQDTEWHVIGQRYISSSNSLEIILDGVHLENFNENNSYSPGSANGQLFIGNPVTTATSYFKGKIQYVQGYNRALSDAEIKQNFEATRSRYGI